jgi:hypothetical protein
MEVEVVTKLEPRFKQPNQRSAAGREERLLRLLVGDASGARSQLSVPYQRRQAPPYPSVEECRGPLWQRSAGLPSLFAATVLQFVRSFACRYDAIRTGEGAEVIVLSNSRAFHSFKVMSRNLLRCFLDS